MTRTGKKQAARMAARLDENHPKGTPQEWAHFFGSVLKITPPSVPWRRYKRVSLGVKAAPVKTMRLKCFFDRTGRYNPSAWRMRARGVERRMVVALVVGTRLAVAA